MNGMKNNAAPAAVAVADELAEPTTWMLVEDLVQAECAKNRLHQEYMGKAMPEDVYQRFERLRDERVPALRAQVYARLAATPAPDAQVPQGSYVSTSGELKPDVSVYSTPAAAPVVLPEPDAEIAVLMNRSACQKYPNDINLRIAHNEGWNAARALLAQAATTGIPAQTQQPDGFVPAAAFDRLQALCDSQAARILAAEDAEPVHWRAVLDPEQVPQQLKASLHAVGFRDQKAAEAWIASELDFNGWRYTLEPLYAAPQAALAAVAVPDERAAFEAWAKSEDMSIGSDCDGYIHSNTAAASLAWQARAALAATPAAAEWCLHCGATASSVCQSKCANRACPQGLPSAAAPVVLPGPDAAISEVMELVKDWAQRDLIAGEAGIDALSEESSEKKHQEAKRLDGEANTAYRAIESKLRALLATGGQAQAVRRGEVLVTVSGFTGSGKSAIAGEIEILCRALGLQVQWPDGDSEKNMTHADWTEALEQYKPRVHIVEQNIPFAAMKGMSK